MIIRTIALESLCRNHLTSFDGDNSNIAEVDCRSDMALNPGEIEIADAYSGSLSEPGDLRIELSQLYVKTYPSEL